jgi:hypothetical protein
MTESEWLLSTDPAMMLRVLGQHASERKLRLFACARCRLLWHELVDDRSRAAVEAAERYAEGLLEEEEREAVLRDAVDAVRELLMRHELAETALRFRRPRAPVRLSRAAALAVFAAWLRDDMPHHYVRNEEKDTLDGPVRAQLLRCIFRGPFRPSGSFSSPAHLVTWAHGIYDDRAFDEMPFLADALDEAGCPDQALLDHLRAPGPHARGCWAIDRLTWRE